MRAPKGRTRHANTSAVGSLRRTLTEHLMVSDHSVVGRRTTTTAALQPATRFLSGDRLALQLSSAERGASTV